MRHFIIGTSGHVDHGKTSLVRALTGIETDRLREEKERGLSIVPGFAFLDLPDAGRGVRRVGVVDVPGHERFLKNMLTGSSGVDVGVLVIAADEGVMPQTREHARVLQLLGVPRLLVALTKADLVEPEWLELLRPELRAFLGALGHDSGWQAPHGAPLLEVSSRTGQGLDALKNALARACDELEASEMEAALTSSSVQPFRMSIDRVFSVAGRGTVVTGSVAQGQARPEDELEAWAPQVLEGAQAARGTIRVRVRGLESHGEPLQVLERGQRGALNLAGPSLELVQRGAVVGSPGSLLFGARWEAWLHIASDATRPFKSRVPARLHLDTAETGVRAVVRETSVLERGQSGLARLRLHEALAANIGDRFVLRDVSSERVWGGGVLLRPSGSAASEGGAEQELRLLHERARALESWRLGDNAPLLRSLLRAAGPIGATPRELGRDLRLLDPRSVITEALARGDARSSVSSSSSREAPGEERLWARETWDHAVQTVETTLRELHQLEAARTLVPVAILAQSTRLPMSLLALVLEEGERAGQWKREGGGVRALGHGARLEPGQQRALVAFEELLETAGWQLPTLEELIEVAGRAGCAPGVARKLASELLRAGQWSRVGPFIAPAQRLEEAARMLVPFFASGAPELLVPQARELFGVSRKWAVPLLEFFDRAGWTRREGDARLPGPRLLRSPGSDGDSPVG
jgi:selenocysteine-specific elongation factor